MYIVGIQKEDVYKRQEKADKRRSEYYNYYSYKTWGAAATYHLCIDSSSLGLSLIHISSFAIVCTMRSGWWMK